MKKTALFLALVTAVGILAAGCGGGGGEKKEAAKEAPKKDAKVLTCATEAMVRPVSYVDKNNNVVGYEVDVLNAIGKKLGYEMKFVKTEFASIFAGVDSGRYDIAFGNLAKRPEREKKFTFTTVTHYYEPAGFFVTKGLLKKHPINKIEDLGGLVTYANPKGDSWQTFCEAYNKKFPNNPIKVNYSDEDWGAYYIRLNKGTMDILKGAESRMPIYAQEYGYNYDFVSLPQEEYDKVNGLAAPEQWFIFQKNEKGVKLAKEFDKAITELREDGTLTKLSIKNLGNDYSSKENYAKRNKK